MKWLDYTEICIGFVLDGKLNPHTVNPSDLYPPYHEVIPILRDGGTSEDVVSKCGYAIVRDAKHASESINGELPPLGWLKLLEKSASQFKSGTDLERVSKDLQAGKDVDLGKILQYVSQIELGYRSMTPLSEVEPETNSWIKTGYAPIDDFFNGLPKAGLTIIAAPPGVGKTFLMLKLGLSMIRKYKKKKVAIFSLEMLMSQLVARYLNMDKKITQEERSRILASESSYTMSEVYAVAARTASSESLSMIGIDFADLLVEGEQSEQVMGSIYRSAAVLAKQTKIPVVLVCQLSRSYVGGLPKIHHIRYSSMAEMMASMIFLLHNPGNTMTDYDPKSVLPPVDGRGYIIGGKARFGFRHGSPGAIQVAWDGEAGWGEKVFGQYIPTMGG